MPTRSLLLALGLMLGAAVVPAQSGPAADSSTQAESVDPRSPRAVLTEYLALTRKGDFVAAAAFFTAESEERGAELSRRLKAVLDTHLWIDLELISGRDVGDLEDGLPRDREQIGTVPGPDGRQEPVQLRRAARDATPAWTFGPVTAGRIDAWYDALDDHWLRERMPLSLQQPGPFGVELWQLGMLGVLLPVAILLAWFLARVSAALLRRLTARTETTLDDALVARTRGPVRALWAVVIFRALVEFVGVPLGVEQGVGLACRALGAVFVTWLMLRVTYVLEEHLPDAPWAADRPAIKSVVPLIGRVARVFLIAIGTIGIVAQFGYSVATLIAGLGIGGIAVALAAQKTLEHVFGSMAIGLDQPIRVGDWIKTGGIEGAVEAIGLRSTRIRTLERSVIAIPNGILSEQMTENLGMRERILLRTKLALEYGTTVAQMRAVRDGLEAALLADPMVWPDAVVVRFFQFGDFSLDIDVIAWIETTDVTVFRAKREALFFRFMEIVETNGCSFAFPTSTVHVKSSDGSGAPRMPVR
jgi:MscS family membrane protein